MTEPENVRTAAKGPFAIWLDDIGSRLCKRLSVAWKERLRSLNGQNTLEAIRTFMMWPFALVLSIALAALYLVRQLLRACVLWWNKLFTEPISALVMLLVLAVLTSAVSAELLRRFKPEITVILSPFELSAKPPRALPITGKVAADLMKDEFRQILDDSRLQFDNALEEAPPSPSTRPASDKGQFAARSVEVEEGSEISAVGIEVEGISLAKIAGLFDSIRQDQRHIEGDVVFSDSSDEDEPRVKRVDWEPAGSHCVFTLQARILKIGSWKTALHRCDEAGLRQAAQELAESVMTDLSPHTITLYLQNHGRTNEALVILRKLVAGQPDNVQNIVDLATSLERSGDSSGAIAEYREALKLTPQFPEQVHYRLGVSFSNNGQSEEAEAEYREAIRLKADYAPAHYGLANLLDRDKVTDDALIEYRKAVIVDNSDPQAHDFYGQALDRRWRTSEAIEQFRDAVRLDPTESQFHLDFAAELEKQGNLDRAITEYRQFAYLSPENPWAHTDLGTVLANNGEVEEAIKEHLRAITLSQAANKDFAEAHNNLGLTYDIRGEYELAAAQYLKAVELKPEAFYAYGNLARSYLRKGDLTNFYKNYNLSVEHAPPGDLAQALIRFGDDVRLIGDVNTSVALYREALDQGEDKAPDAYVGLGYALIDSGDTKGALEALQKARSLRDGSDIHEAVGYLLENAGRSNAALSEYQMAVHLNPDNLDALRSLAGQLAEHGEYQDAKRQRIDAWAGYARASRKAPNDLWADIYLGDILGDLGANVEAKERLSKAVDIGMGQPEPHNSLGTVLEQLYRSDGNVAGSDGQGEAIAQYKLAIQASPDAYRDSFNNLGSSLELEGRHTEAAQEFRTLLVTVPDDVPAHLGLGQIHEDVGQYTEALAEYNVALALNRKLGTGGNDDDFPAGHSSLCRTLNKAGQYERALSECNISFMEEPNNAEVHLDLGDALLDKSAHCSFCWHYWLKRQAQREYSIAAEESNAALNYRPGAEGYVLLGRAYIGLGQYPAAIQQLELALKWKPIYPLAHRYLGIALTGSGQSEAARPHFEKALRCGPGLTSTDC